MKRVSAYLLALLIIFILISPLLIGISLAKTTTPTPTKSEPVFPPPNLGSGIYTVKGTVYDTSGKAIQNANVTLYNVVYVDNEYKAKEKASTNSNNPQSTGDGYIVMLGQYVFTGVQSGHYILTAEKDGKIISQDMWVTGDMLNNDIAIQGYVENGVSPSPGPTVTEGPTYRAPPMPTLEAPAPDIGSILGDIFRISLMAIIGVQLIASLAILALGLGKR